LEIAVEVINDALPRCHNKVRPVHFFALLVSVSGISLQVCRKTSLSAHALTSLKLPAEVKRNMPTI
jgi:hypothetical protein